MLQGSLLWVQKLHLLLLVVEVADGPLSVLRYCLLDLLLILLLLPTTVGKDLNVMCLPYGTTVSSCPWLLVCET